MAATSVGIVHGNQFLDLCYDEDSNAAVDFNVVMTGKGEFVEVQGTAEKEPFGKKDLDELTALAQIGIQEIMTAQKKALKGIKIG